MIFNFVCAVLLWCCIFGEKKRNFLKKITQRTFFALSLLCALNLQSQVFMRPFDNAAALGSAGAGIAAPGLQFGLVNDAQLGMGLTYGVWAGGAIPYGLSGWQSAQFQALFGMGKSSGIGLDIQHNGVNELSEQRIRLAYGRKLGARILLGGSLDALRLSASEYGSTTQGTFSVSMLAQVLPQVWIGARAQNPFQLKIGPDLVPTVLRTGVCWNPSKLLLALFEVEKELERQASVKAGVEYRPGALLALRLGVRNAEVTRMSFGLGLRLKNSLQIDAASEWHPALGITPAIMISYNK